MMKATIVAGAIIAAATAAPAQAIINSPVPTANYITFGSNDWAWASPCQPSGAECGDNVSGKVDFSYQGTLGWRLPTLAELLAGPSATDFGSASSFKCASAYFSVGYTHCDYSNGASGYVWGLSNISSGETWVTREAVAGVPEPSTWAMMLLGFGAIGMAFRGSRRPVMQTA